VLAVEGFHRFGGKPITDLRRAFVAAEVRRHVVFAQSYPGGRAKCRSLRLPTQEFQHHRRREDRTQWVRYALSCDIGGRAVYRLEERSLARVNVS